VAPAATLKDDPGPIDLRSMADARECAATAIEKCPAPNEFFQCIVAQLRELRLPDPSVLELESGPDFLHSASFIPSLPFNTPCWLFAGDAGVGV
jgi:hypothetical protein